MQIGRKLYYDISTGKVLVDKGEMQGAVRETTLEEDKLAYAKLSEYTESTIGVLKLAYGERSQEFNDFGSMKVNNDELIIYPKLTITVNKYEIVTDGIDTTTITVTIQDVLTSHSINFTVNDGSAITVNTVNGIAELQFDTTLPGDYIIKAESDIYGINSITIKGV